MNKEIFEIKEVSTEAQKGHVHEIKFVWSSITRLRYSISRSKLVYIEIDLEKPFFISID